VLTTCRSCGTAVTRTFVDLGSTPLANSYLVPEEVASERSFRLHAVVCDACLLVQLTESIDPAAIFSDYAYFSSYSTSWLEHTQRFAEGMTERLGLGGDSLVVELASNDGYLLRHFVARGVPVLGVEPATNVAEVAVAEGVPTEVCFFGERTATVLASRGVQADLVVANNVVAHVPDLNDFLRGIPTILGQGGIVSFEFPHLLRLIEEVQFDTIYHEHYSYFSLWSLHLALGRHGLRVFEVEQLPTHGGSLRVLACWEPADRPEHRSVEEVLVLERQAALHVPEGYEGFDARVERCRASLRDFLDCAGTAGRRVVGYGAAAKGNTLLNVTGVTAGDVDYVVDRNPHKQGRLLPGSHIPVQPVEHVAETKPDYLLVLPWNLRAEIEEQMAYIRDWGGRFVTGVPDVRIF
jgi:SAM-dependent methyltransferase